MVNVWNLLRDTKRLDISSRKRKKIKGNGKQCYEKRVNDQLRSTIIDLNELLGWSSPHRVTIQGKFYLSRLSQ